MKDVISFDVQALDEALRACGCTRGEGVIGELVYELPRERLLDAVRALVAADVHHLSTITGQRQQDHVSVMYHFYGGRGITLRVLLPLDDLRLSSITGAVLVANWYERELYEMLGVEIQGRGEIKPLLLPDDWEGPPPLFEEEDDA